MRREISVPSAITRIPYSLYEMNQKVVKFAGVKNSIDGWLILTDYLQKSNLLEQIRKDYEEKQGTDNGY